MDWNALSNLYEVAPLGYKRPQDLQVAFTNSLYKCFVFDGGVLVGAGRVLADGVDCACICDVAVYPAYQGGGVGSAIVSKLINFSYGHKKIILYANPQKELFYEKLGFKKMATAMAIFENQTQAFDLGLIKE